VFTLSGPVGYVSHIDSSFKVSGLYRGEAMAGYWGLAQGFPS